MADLAINLPPEPLRKIRELFFCMKFDKLTYRKLRWGRWHKKVKAIKELYAFNITTKNKYLYKLINSKNSLLRMEAQVALVDLSKEDPNANPFNFLHKLEAPFSLWEQITLHQVLVQRDIKVPDFGDWLYRDNKSVVMFCLRMIKEYKQVQNEQKIKVLMHHSDENVRRLAYQVLGDLKLVGALKEVRRIYKDEPFDNQLEIIRSMRKCADSTFISFLRKVIDKEESAEILVEGVKAIKDSGEIGREILKKMMESEYKDYNIIIKHVLDNRII
jgi:hypothetical protein